MRYTFIYDIYGNVNFFILFSNEKFAYNMLFITVIFVTVP